MDNNMNERTVEKQKRNIESPILIVGGMIFFALLIAELYLIKRIPENYLIIIGVGILVLIDVYLIMDEIIKIINKNYKQKMLQIEEYMKSQKAIYLANKRGFESVIEKLEEVDKNNREAMDDLYTGQKTIAKTIIKKNIESFGEVRSAIEAIRFEVPEHFAEKHETKEDSTYNLAFDIEKSKLAIVDAINNTGEEFTEMKNECVEIKNACQTLINKLEGLSSMESIMKKPESSDTGFPKPESTEIESSEAVEQEEEQKVEMNQDFDPNKQMTADEIAALIASMQ